MEKLITMIGLGSLLVGCNPSKCEKASDIDNSWSMHGRGVVTKEITISGYTYIIITCYGESCNLLHSKSCSCGK